MTKPLGKIRKLILREIRGGQGVSASDVSAAVGVPLEHVEAFMVDLAQKRKVHTFVDDDDSIWSLPVGWNINFSLEE